MLIFLRNKQNYAIQVFNYIGSADAKNITLNFNDKSYWQTGSVNYSSLSETPWNMVIGEAQNMFEKLEEVFGTLEYGSPEETITSRARFTKFYQKIIIISWY
jgi:hypothetical protein